LEKKKRESGRGEYEYLSSRKPGLEAVKDGK